MRSSKAFIVAVSILLLSVLHQPVRALTFDYNTKAQALVEIIWYGYLVSVAESTKNDKKITVRLRTKSASLLFSLNCPPTLFKKLINHFSGQTISNDILENSLFGLLLPHNRVNKTRLWQKTPQPTLAA